MTNLDIITYNGDMERRWHDDFRLSKIYKEKELIGQGGNQDWFADSWARKAGCASVSATDIFIYYTKREREFDKSTYLDYMNEMFKLMEPGKRGFPYVFYMQDD